jgi:hypothetical protein
MFILKLMNNIEGDGELWEAHVNLPHEKTLKRKIRKDYRHNAGRNICSKGEICE